MAGETRRERLEIEKIRKKVKIDDTDNEGKECNSRLGRI